MRSHISRSSIVSELSMAGFNDTTFTVGFVDHSEHDLIKTTITITDQHIECPFTPNIPFKELSGILINTSHKTEYKKRSFGLKSDENIFEFLVFHHAKRDKILKEIMSKLPATDVNRDHLERIETSQDALFLVVDHGDKHSVMFPVLDFGGDFGNDADHEKDGSHDSGPTSGSIGYMTNMHMYKVVLQKMEDMKRTQAKREQVLSAKYDKMKLFGKGWMKEREEFKNNLEVERSKSNVLKEKLSIMEINFRNASMEKEVFQKKVSILQSDLETERKQSAIFKRKSQELEQRISRRQESYVKTEQELEQKYDGVELTQQKWDKERAYLREQIKNLEDHVLQLQDDLVNEQSQVQEQRETCQNWEAYCDFMESEKQELAPVPESAEENENVNLKDRVLNLEDLENKLDDEVRSCVATAEDLIRRRMTLEGSIQKLQAENPKLKKAMRKILEKAVDSLNAVQVAKGTVKNKIRGELRIKSYQK